MSIIFNEAALQNLLQSPDGPVGQKLRFVSEQIVSNYEDVIGTIWQNQSPLSQPSADYQVTFGDFGLQSEIGMDDGRVAEYMGAKFHREDWIVPAIMAGWEDPL